MEQKIRTNRLNQATQISGLTGSSFGLVTKTKKKMGKFAFTRIESCKGTYTSTCPTQLLTNLVILLYMFQQPVRFFTYFFSQNLNPAKSSQLDTFSTRNHQVDRFQPKLTNDFGWLEQFFFILLVCITNQIRKGQSKHRF